jgi:uncharacterized protein (DUF1778 family)
MNKTTRLFVRVSEIEKQAVRKASRSSKSLSSFFIDAIQTVIRYRRLIAQIKEYERQGIKLSVLEVKTK